jgi:hypothetical protein
VLNQTVPAGKEKAPAECADSSKAKMNDRKKMFFISTKKRNFEKKEVFHHHLFELRVLKTFLWNKNPTAFSKPLFN